MIQYDKMSNKLGYMQLKRMNKNISSKTIRNVFSSLITYYKRIIIKALLNLEITQQKTEHDRSFFLGWKCWNIHLTYAIQRFCR